MSRDGSETDPTAQTIPAAGAMTPTPAAGSDRYELRERLGEGAMGVVWAAHDRALDRMVALKVLNDRFLGATHQERLANEARAMARLSHRNVVAVYDVGEREGRTYLTMELVRGVDLAQWLESPRDVSTILEVFRAAAAGLAAAHAAGIVHRDVKPSNILIADDGEVRVADFGVAHAGSRPITVDGAATPTSRTTGLIGSPAYMAPEQLRGEPASALGDQFGLCIALYEALHGRRPFDGQTIHDLRAAIEQGVPPPVRDVPAWLHAVIARGLAADPAERFPSMAELSAALAGPRRPRRRWIAAAAVAVAVGGGALGATLLARGGHAGPSCAAVERELVGVWDDDARARVRAGFAALNRPWADATSVGVVAGLDDYAATWVSARRRACEGGRARGAAAVARQERCLDDRRRVLHQLVTTLAAADVAVAAEASAATRDLPAIADCENPAYLDGVVATSDTQAAREELAVARVQHLAGRVDEAAKLAGRVVTAARDAGDRGLEAEALLVQGRADARAGRAGPAVEAYRLALAAAGEVGADTLRIDTWIAMSAALQRLTRFDEAAQVLDLAEAALRERPDREREGRILEIRGVLRSRQGRAAEALELLEQARAVYVEVLGESSPGLASIYNNLAVVLRKLDRHDEAMAAQRRILELLRPFGDDHPEVGRTRQAIAFSLGKMGRFAEAEAEFAAAEKILIGALGEQHADVALLYSNRGGIAYRNQELDAAADYYRRGMLIHEQLTPGAPEGVTAKSNLASVLLELGRVDEAEPLVRELLPARVAAFGELHSLVATAHLRLAQVHELRGRFDEAIAECAEARRIETAVNGADHTSVAWVAYNEARIERRRQRYRRALELDQEALRIRRARLPAGHLEIRGSLHFVAEDLLKVGQPARALARAEELLALITAAGNPVDVRLVEFLVARALWDSRKDRARALELVRRSHAELAPLVGDRDIAKHVADIDAWLDRNDPERRGKRRRGSSAP